MILNRTSLFRHFCLSSVAILAVGCQPGTKDGGSADEALPDGRLTAGPVQDLGSLVPARDLAFVHEADGYKAGYLTHQVAIREGIIGFTPQHLDPASSKQVIGGAAGFETTAVLAGGQLVSAGVDSEMLTAPNIVRVQRGDVIEEITNREDGVEQVWRFGVKPADGDVTVEVAVSGQRFVVANDSGLHFKDDRGLGIRYSHAVWRDANGEAFEIPVRFEDEQIRITVPESIVVASAYPAVLDPTITAELFTDVPANGTTGANSRNQDIAFNGSGYFVVWQDQRDSRDDDIFGARVGATGTVTDLDGIRINAAAGIQQNPSVSFVGDGYLVAWENRISTTNNDIVAAFVSTSGAVTQLGTIAGTASNEVGPEVAARGSEALLVWSDGSNVRGAIYNGTAFGAPFNIAAGANVEKEPTVSSNASGDYLVVYTETVAAGNDNIRGVMVTAAGLAGTAFDIDASAGMQRTPSAAFDGTNHIVVWETVSNVAGARVSAVGALLDATPIAINTNSFAQQLPDVACNASACFVAWQDSRNAASVRDIYGALLTPALAVTTNDIPVAGQARAQLSPSIVANGSGYFAAWTDNRDLEYNYVRGSRIDSGGTAQDTDGIVLVRSTSRFQSPAITQASVTDVFFADSQASDVNLVHVRFGTTAAQLDNPPKVASSAAGAQLNPAAASMGATPIAVWQDTRGTDRDIYAARINASTGAPLDPNGIAVSTATLDQVAPAVASSGTSALVVWQDRRNGATSGFDIYGAVINSNGTVTVNDIAVCTGAGDQSAPSVAYDSVNGVYLVAFNHPAGALVHVNGVRVTAAGSVIDANCGAVLSGTSGSQFSPSVAYGGGQFMVVWEDRRNDANLGDIYGARVNATNGLAVVDPTGITIAQVAGSAQSQPTVAFGGSYAGSYLIAWTDRRNSGSTGTDIYGAQVGANNGVVAPAFIISATAENESAPALAPGSTAQKPFSIAYSKSSTALNSVRFQLRQIAIETSGGQPCSQDSQCATGFCADGVCCDSQCGGNNRSDCQACSVRLGASANGTCTILPASLNYICRDYANRTDSPNCDLREYCDGTSAQCPPDIGTRQGQTCTMLLGGTGVCPANDPSGAPHVCQ